MGFNPDGYLLDLFGLDESVALVTGGGSGLGRQIAIALAGAGANIIVVGRREEMLQQTAEMICNADDDCTPCVEAETLAADITKIKEIERVVKEGSRFFGPPDILVNAAGMNNRIPADKMSPDDWQRTIDINLRAPFLLSRGFVEAPKGMGKRKRGSIINVGSLQSVRAGLGDAAYGASKGGVAQLTRSLAREWGPRNIRVNALLPGFFRTDMTEKVWKDKELLARLKDTTLLQRNGQLEDVEGAAVFLASRASAYITGLCLPVDGGFLAR